jgi:hypothetical protein
MPMQGSIDEIVYADARERRRKVAFNTSVWKFPEISFGAYLFPVHTLYFAGASSIFLHLLLRENKF